AVDAIIVQNGPFGVAFTPDGQKAYVTNFNADSVSVIDVSSDTVLTTITDDIGGNPVAEAVTSDGAKADVASFDETVVSVIDVNDDAVFATITVGFSPAGVGIAPIPIA